MNNPKDSRQFLKSGDWDAWAKSETDQVKKIPIPELQKGYPEGTVQVGLTDPGVFKVGRISFIDVISKRASRRQYTAEDLTLEELSYLLWATQGIKKGNKLHRAVPSGGARHPFETYLAGCRASL